MDLELESGRIIREVSEEDLLYHVEGKDFAILSTDPMSYIQCAEQEDHPHEYIPEYQDGSLHEHYRAVDEPITLDRALSAFIKYLRGDRTWYSDFLWEKPEP